MKRRTFIRDLGLGTACSFIPSTVLPFNASENHTNKKLNFGIVTDVHKDLMPDADERLKTFISEANRREVDFVIQLGDFCMADKENNDFMDILDTYKGPKYHVLGNHDMDRNSKDEMLDFWGMPSTFYSYDFQGFHFVVLDAIFLYKDGKYIDYEKGNFYVNDKLRTFIDDEQLEWFKSDLEGTKLPTIVFSHQSLWHYQWGVKNRLKTQKILEAHKEKVICCMNGHNHIDYHHHQNGIDYLEINSMSYQWMEDKYRNTERYPSEMYETNKWLPNLATYKDPLYAFATLDPKGSMFIEGVRSDWVSPSPSEMGMPDGVLGSKLSTDISDYSLEF